MTTFVRRTPAEFDTLYWRTAPGYMERELGAVDAGEAERHDSPRGFSSVAGKAEGQRKDQGYCFAPYDGLRGLGMPDFHASVDHEVQGLGQMPPPAYPGAPIVPLGETPPASEGFVTKALPYVIAAAGILWLFKKTAEETASLPASLGD